jgi:hypothetical protein
MYSVSSYLFFVIFVLNLIHHYKKTLYLIGYPQNQTDKQIIAHEKSPYSK